MRYCFGLFENQVGETLRFDFLFGGQELFSHGPYSVGSKAMDFQLRSSATKMPTISHPLSSCLPLACYWMTSAAAVGKLLVQAPVEDRHTWCGSTSAP